MFKKYRLPLLLSFLVMVLPIPAGLILREKLPSTVPIHIMSLLFLALHGFCLFFTHRDVKNKNQSSKVFFMMLWVMPFISLFTTAISFALSTGYDLDVTHFVCILFGAMFVLIGNYLPKCKQNRTIGIKLKWTFEDETNWNATHRMAGKVWVIGGLLMLSCIFLPNDISLWVIPALLTVMVVVPVAYSYSFHKKQKDDITHNTQIPRMDKRITMIGSIFGALILIGSVALCFTGDIDMQVDESSITVKATYWQDLTLRYEDIDCVELYEEGVSGTRVYGFGTPRLLMGAFRNDDFGNYTRYTYTKANACIVLTVDDDIIVIGCQDDDATYELYKLLKQEI